MFSSSDLKTIPSHMHRCTHILLSGAVISESSRTVLIKLFYQIGFEKPYILTLICCIAMSSALLLSCGIRGIEAIWSCARITPKPLPLPEETELEDNQWPSDKRIRLQMITDSYEYSQSSTAFAKGDDEPNKKVEEEPTEAFSSLQFIIPIVFRVIALCLELWSLLLLSISTQVLLKGGLDLFVSVLILAFLAEETIPKHRLYGALISTVGSGLVILSHMYGLGTHTAARQAMLGIFLVFLRVVVASFHEFLKERFVTEQGDNEFWNIGLEGIYGTIIACIMIAPFHYHDFLSCFKHLATEPVLFVMLILLLIIIAFNITFSVLATTRTNVIVYYVWTKNTRLVLVWALAFLVYAFTTHFHFLPNSSAGEEICGYDSNGNWSKCGYEFWAKTFGCLFIIYGTIVFYVEHYPGIDKLFSWYRRWQRRWERERNRRDGGGDLLSMLTIRGEKSQRPEHAEYGSL